VALGASDWPRGVRLQLDPVTGPTGTNLGLAAVAEGPNQVAAQATAPIGVRVMASGEPGIRARGTLRWETAAPGARALDIDLAAGETRTLQVPARVDAAGAQAGVLALTGDNHAFDNRLALAPSIAQAVEVLYVGSDDGKDPKGPLFFLERALPATRSRAPHLRALPASNAAAITGALAPTHLVVLTADPPAEALPGLRAHLEGGKTVLYLLPGAASAATLSTLAGASGDLALREAPAGREAVLTDIDLGHPVLAPFADGRFSDFTKVRFWKRRLLDPRALPGARVLARFDDGAPAWLAVRVGRGLLWVMTSGWQPADSQLALSSKFVPLLWSLLETSAGLGSGQAQFFVGDEVVLPLWAATATGVQVRKPDGARAPLTAGAGVFHDTNEPGLYTLEAAGQPPLTFAVNVPPPESAVAPMPIEQLERLGIELRQGGTAARSGDAAALARAQEQRRRSAFFLELETQQRTWRWLLGAALLALVAETLLAGRRRRASGPTIRSAEEAT
jgi:hypothetical protein